MIPKKYRPFRWVRYLLRKKRIKHIKVHSDIRRRRELVNHYLELSASKYAFIKELYIYDLDELNKHIILSPRFNIEVSEFSDGSDAERFEQMIKRFCELLGFELTSGYSSMGDTPEYFYRVTDGVIIRDILHQDEMRIWYCENNNRYNKNIDKYIKKYLR